MYISCAASMLGYVVADWRFFIRMWVERKSPETYRYDNKTIDLRIFELYYREVYTVQTHVLLLLKCLDFKFGACDQWIRPAGDGLVPLGIDRSQTTHQRPPNSQSWMPLQTERRLCCSYEWLFTLTNTHAITARGFGSEAFHACDGREGIHPGSRAAKTRSRQNTKRFANSEVLTAFFFFSCFEQEMLHHQRVSIRMSTHAKSRSHATLTPGQP